MVEESSENQEDQLGSSYRNRGTIDAWSGQSGNVSAGEK